MKMFIPNGDSHGVSNIYSIIGKIATVNEENRSLRERFLGGYVSGHNPAIWLDRSKVQGKNEVGSPADLNAGRTVEVKYKEAPPVGNSVIADWIKVEMAN